MKKQFKIILLASCLSLLTAIPAFAGWQQTENGQWQYEQDGAILTGQWQQDQGSWYYLDANGMMLAGTTQNINGVDYVFGADGKWIEPAAAKEGWNTYRNSASGYTFQYPVTIPETYVEYADIALEIDDRFIAALSIQPPAGVTESDYADLIMQYFFDLGVTTLQSQSAVQLGGIDFTKYHYVHKDDASINLDVFMRYDSSNSYFYCIFTVYYENSRADIMEILNTFTLVR